MTTELVLLLGIYAFIVIGVFLGDNGPVATFKKAAPRFSARIERNVSIGHRFVRDGQKAPNWTEKQE